MILRLSILLIGVLCQYGGAELSKQIDEANYEKSNNPQLGVTMLTTDMFSPKLILPDTISEQCRNDFDAYKNAILNPKILNIRKNLWAWKMLDATGKFPDGILQGNFNALGSYSSCIEIEAEIGNHTFGGKFGGVSYIVSEYDPADPASAIMPLYGVCLPSSCSDDDFYGIMYEIDKIRHSDKKRFIWIPKLSVANDPYQLEGGDIVMIIFWPS